MMLFAIALMLAVSMANAEELTAPGPLGTLAGTYLPAGEGAPVVLIVPGSGPTDRDGNNPLGVRASTYRLIAEGLAQRGIASVRIDKRGMFGSAGAVPDANAVTIGDYASDVHAWIAAIRDRTGVPYVWVLGHSEGALVALAAAQRPGDICGLLLVAGPGRRAADILRTQMEINQPRGPMLSQALAAIATLEAGGEVDTSTMAPELGPVFAPSVQAFMRDLFSYDPAALIAPVTLPMIILQGETDIQVEVQDAERLKAANPAAELELIAGANHVLKTAPADDLTTNLATYTDPSLPLAPGVIDALAKFVRGTARH